MVKPKLLLSRCFNENVRYNGGIIQDKVVEKLKTFIEPIYVCPEVEIGLGIPRPKIIIVKEGDQKRLFQVDTGRDFTKDMLQFTEKLKPLLKNLEGILLKSGSPSCGVGSTKMYYKGNVVGKTSGFLAESIKTNFPELPLEDEGRLKDPEIYYHFLVRIFALAEWRNFLREASPSKLISFHSAYKFLLKTCDEQLLRELGHLVARSNLTFSEKIALYGSLFKKALTKKPTRAKHLNTLYHLAGYFTRKINPKEKRHFLKLLDKYRRGKVELKTPLELIKSWAFRFEENYILSQKYLQPFPEELE